MAALLSLALALPSPSPAAVEQIHSWVDRVRFVPTATEISGIPIREIDPGWARASALNDLAMPPESKVPGESVADHGGSFSLRHDFDSDGILETAIVGVYSDRTGGAGRFLVILDESESRPSRLRAKFLNPGEPGFSALKVDNGEFIWGQCMECDVFSVISFQAGKFRRRIESCAECG